MLYCKFHHTDLDFHLLSQPAKLVSSEIKRILRSFYEQKYLTELEQAIGHSPIDELTERSVSRAQKDDKLEDLKSQLSGQLERFRLYQQQCSKQLTRLQWQHFLPYSLLGVSLSYLYMTVMVSRFETGSQFAEAQSPIAYAYFPILFILSIVVPHILYYRKYTTLAPDLLQVGIARGLCRLLTFALAGLACWIISFLVFLIISEIGPDFPDPLYLYFSAIVAVFATLSIWLFYRSGKLTSKSEEFARNMKDTRKKHEGQIESTVLALTDRLASHVDFEVKELQRGYQLVVDPWSDKMPQYRLERAGRNLSERYENYTPTLAFRELNRHIEEMDHGSIGISGDRGLGKTSVMRALRSSLERDGRALTMWISAPTAVREKEFLLSVLAKLATSVGARLTHNALWPDEEPNERLRVQRRIRWIDTGAIFSILVAVILTLVFYLGEIAGSDGWQYCAASIILPVVYFVMRWIRAVIFHAPYSADTTDPALLLTTSELLEEIWYERKDVALSDVSLGYRGSGIRAQTSKEKKRQPLTLPHLVDMWNAYVEQITSREVGGAFSKVVVFIDEVDKIQDVRGIGTFLLILKALYEPTNLFFLVSVSEDAYDEFRERAALVGSRNEFDSSFDLTINVERMDHGNVQELLSARILGPELPNAISLFIWMTSKGNPRDVIRLGRDCLRVNKDLEEQGKNKVVCVHEICVLLLTEHIKNVAPTYQKILARTDGQPVINAVASLCAGESDIKHLRHVLDDAIRKVEVAADEEECMTEDAGQDMPKMERIRTHRAKLQNVLAELWYILLLIDLFGTEDRIRDLKNVLDSRGLRTVEDALEAVFMGLPMKAKELLKCFSEGIEKAHAEDGRRTGKLPNVIDQGTKLPDTSEFPQGGAIALKVSADTSLRILKESGVQRIARGTERFWRVESDAQGREWMSAQAICWLYCWGAQGSVSGRVEEKAQRAFDQIFDRSHEWLAERLPLQQARQLRYKAGNVEEEFKRLLRL